MDTTLLVMVGITIASVLVLAIAAAFASKSGKFAVAGAGRGRRGDSRIGSSAGAATSSASATAASAVGGRSALASPAVLDLPVMTAPQTAPGFPSGPAPSAPSPFAPSPAQHAELAVERLQARMDARFDALERDLRTRLEAVARDLAAVKETDGAALAAFESRQTAALRDVRADLVPLLARGAQSETLPIARERRADASAEMYAMVARLESAISQVTNPVLLPGEAYAPPVDFFAEALAWENWKDVGERAFALADAFSARRLYLSEQTAVALAGFVTTLRGVLTRSVYPNLVPDATTDQLDTLRSAMGSLAAELPKIRRVLESEYRSASEGPSPS